MDVPILAYHKVNNKFEWGITTVSVRSFHNQIKYLADHRYYTISLERYFAGYLESETNRRPVIITFDDADESIYHHAFPILNAYGFTATVFVISEYVGKRNNWDANLGGIYSRHLSWDQIEALVKAGWEIGSHTATHLDLLRLSDEDVQHELRSSREIIEQKIERPIRFISYPFNRFDQRIISIAQQAGYSGGCVLSAKKNINSVPEQFVMPRHGVYSIDTIYWFKKKLNNSLVERLKQRLICFAATGTIWYNRFRN